MTSPRFGMVFWGRNHPVGYGPVVLFDTLSAAIHLAKIQPRSSLVNAGGVYFGAYDETSMNENGPSLPYKNVRLEDIFVVADTQVNKTKLPLLPRLEQVKRNIPVESRRRRDRQYWSVR